MRKVEREMLAAIRERRDWSGGNTEVVHDKSGLITDVFLHGNHIAAIVHCKSRLVSVVTPNRTTFWAYPTRTTISRLRALGVNAYVRDGLPFIGDEVLLPREV